MKSILIKNAKVLYQNKYVKKDILIINDLVEKFENNIDYKANRIIDAKGLAVLPGLIDIHTHLRQPGYEYKETIKTGSQAAAKGGYTTICAMPNTSPAIDEVKKVLDLKKVIKADSSINVLVYSSITKERKHDTKLVDFNKLAKYVFAFSNDGNGIQDEQTMKEAMIEAKKVKKPIIAHCEIEALVNGGCIHDGKYLNKFNLKGISSASEYEQVKRDIELVKKINGDYYSVVGLPISQVKRVLKDLKII